MSASGILKFLLNFEIITMYNYSEDLIKNMAKLMVSDGYLAVGYEYIIIDDCWSALERNENDELQPDATRFPSGIPALSKYVSSYYLKI